jgi:hypothetical protein
MVGVEGIRVIGIEGVVGIRKAEPNKGKIGPEKTAVVPEEKRPTIAEEAAVAGKRAAVKPTIVPKREAPARAPKVVAKRRPAKTARPHPHVASAHMTAKGFRSERQRSQGDSRQKDAKLFHRCNWRPEQIPAALRVGWFAGQSGATTTGHERRCQHSRPSAPPFGPILSR